MDKILDLAIAYPDFQLNQVIDPEQIDLNNSQIVSKLNNLIGAINTFSQGTTGATQIKIAPLTQFSTATTIQTALDGINAYCKATSTTLTEILAKSTAQDTRIATNENTLATINTKNTTQDTSITSLTTRITNEETKGVTRSADIESLKTKDVVQDTRLTNIEMLDTAQNTRLTNVETKATDQSSRIANIESREELDNNWINAIDGRVENNALNINKFQETLTTIGAGNPTVELINARTSGHTGETFDVVGDRLDKLEIPIAMEIEESKRSNINFIITDSTNEHGWESGVKLADLNIHNDSENAHAEMMALHELDVTSHGDIRDMVNIESATRTNVDTELQTQITALSGVDTSLQTQISRLGIVDTDIQTQTTTLGNQLNILNNGRGYLSSKAITTLSEITANGKYNILDSLEMPTQGRYLIEATHHSTQGYYYFEATGIYGASIGLKYYMIKSGTTSVSWKQIATTDITTTLGNQLNGLNVNLDKKASAVTIYLNHTSGDLLDTTTNTFVLCALSSTNNASLFNIMGSSFAYVNTYFYSSVSETSNRYQIAVGYDTDTMAFRRYKGVWEKWQQISTTTKTNFSCTANTGFTILDQNCYYRNGKAHIYIKVKKTDDSIFAQNANTQVVTLPFTSTRNIPLSFFATRSASNDWRGQGTAWVYINSIGIVLDNGTYSTDVTNVFVSGEVDI